MIPGGRSPRFRTGIPVLLLGFLALSCGSGGSDYAGGGTGGSGISTGSITAFGSVEVNGVHFRTDNKTEKRINGADKSAQRDEDVFSVGMVVTVRHGTGDNNAQTIEYRDNLRGPVAGITSGAGNIIEVLGYSVVLDNAAAFASIKANDVVEVSGFADAAGRIRATYILSVSPSLPPPAQEFEVKGFISGLSGNTFRLGPLPDGTGVTVTVSYGATAVAGLPGGLANRAYVEVVTLDRAPVDGSITATRIERLAARTEFPDKAPVGLEGLVTFPPGGSGKALSFAVEGKEIRTGDATDFTGHSPAEIQSNARLQVQGTETGGVLSAARIVFR